MDPDAWGEQRDRVLSAAKAGHWFGTVSSEPGGGGNLMATRATAALGSEGVWRVTGDKQMGSGSGVTSFMMTVAVPEGEETPDIFLLDTAVQGAIASWIGQVVLFGSPQVDHAAIDFQIDFVQMPGCVRLGPAFDSIDPNRTKLPREFTRLSVDI
jgi:alkylation response protein AidB-like acyl-CoA dehydrogenase